MSINSCTKEAKVWVFLHWHFYYKWKGSNKCAKQLQNWQELTVMSKRYWGKVTVDYKMTFVYPLILVNKSVCRNILWFVRLCTMQIRPNLPFDGYSKQFHRTWVWNLCSITNRSTAIICCSWQDCMSVKAATIDTTFVFLLSLHSIGHDPSHPQQFASLLVLLISINCFLTFRLPLQINCCWLCISVFYEWRGINFVNPRNFCAIPCIVVLGFVTWPYCFFLTANPKNAHIYQIDYTIILCSCNPLHFE